MTIDRDATLRRAEKFLRQGRLDQAISEYNKILQEQPRDWSTINVVGDLLVRAGQPESGIEHFTRIADHFFDEGFLPRAAAVYKKILKVAPDADHAALRTAEIAERQGLIADAKAALSHAAARRLRRGDKTGASDIHLKLGRLEPADLASGIASARTAAELGNMRGAVGLLLQIAQECQRRERPADAIKVLDEAARLDPENRDVRAGLVTRLLETGELERAVGYAASAPEFKAIAAEYYARGSGDEALQVLQWALDQEPSDIETRRQLVRAHVGRADLDRARALLSGDVTDAELLLNLAEVELRTFRYEEGRAAAARLMGLDPGRRDDLTRLGMRLAASDAEGGFQCVDVAADAAVAENDFSAAAAALRDFVAHVPGHVPALMKLVEVCVDGGLGAAMYAAQAQLADAYLDTGRASEARVIAEDLVAREPWEAVNIERLRRALVMLGEPDPDSVIADRLSGDSPFTSTDLTLDFSFNLLAGRGEADEATVPAGGEGRAAGAADGRSPETIDLAAILGDVATAPLASGADTVEIDLDGTFGSLEVDEPGDDRSEDTVPEGLASLERVFEGFHDEAVNGAHTVAARFRQALLLQEAGDTESAVPMLEQVARAPRYRFKAAAELARIHRGLGHTGEAIEWFERAAEFSPAGTDESRDLLYDLGRLLAESGETERALAVFLELQADAPDYRDVGQLVARLSQKA